MNILIVDDEASLLSNLSSFLSTEGFKIFTAANFSEAKSFNLKSIDLVVLDWMLPDGAGIDLLKEWRKKGISKPVIFLTAKADIVDKVLGLESGSNDYITKPFDPRELLARIRIHFRDNMKSEIVVNNISINLDDRVIKFEGKQLDLTKTEFELLKFLMSNPNKVFSRDEILQSVWGYDQFPTTRTVDVHIMQLRQKFKPEFFETVHGIGYRMKRLD